jgi:YVTN family beta-propeller protein
MSDAMIPGCALGVSIQTLSAWRDQALPAQEQDRMRGHIAGCASCKRRLAQYDAVARALRILPTPEPVGGYGHNPRHTDRGPENISGWSRLRIQRTPPLSLNSLAAILIVALIAGLFALFGPTRSLGRITLPVTPTLHVTTTPAPPIAVIAATIDLRTPPTGAGANGTAPWFLDVVDHVLAQVDPASNQVVASFKVPDDVYVATSAAGSLWLARTTSGVVERRDPHDGHIIATITVEPGLRAGMVVSPGTVWVASGKGNHIWRINTSTNRVTATITVGQFPRGLAVSGNALWVCSRDDQQGLWRIDMDTNQVVAKVDVTGGVTECGGVSVSPDGAVWVINWNDSTDENTLVRVDSSANTTTDSVPLGTGIAFGFAVQTNAIWVVSSDSKTLLEIDPARNSNVGHLALDSQPVQAMFAEGALWAQAGSTDSGGSLVAGSRLWHISQAA